MNKLWKWMIVITFFCGFLCVWHTERISLFVYLFFLEKKPFFFYILDGASTLCHALQHPHVPKCSSSSVHIVGIRLASWQQDGNPLSFPPDAVEPSFCCLKPSGTGSYCRPTTARGRAACPIRPSSIFRALLFGVQFTAATTHAPLPVLQRVHCPLRPSLRLD